MCVIFLTVASSLGVFKCMCCLIWNEELAHFVLDKKTMAVDEMPVDEMTCRCFV
jgi:hypothetical protein